jgi:hypothetical protein
VLSWRLRAVALPDAAASDDLVLKPSEALPLFEATSGGRRVSEALLAAALTSASFDPRFVGANHSVRFPVGGADASMDGWLLMQRRAVTLMAYTVRSAFLSKRDEKELAFAIRDHITYLDASGSRGVLGVQLLALLGHGAGGPGAMDSCARAALSEPQHILRLAEAPGVTAALAGAVLSASLGVAPAPTSTHDTRHFRLEESALLLGLTHDLTTPVVQLHAGTGASIIDVNATLAASVDSEAAPDAPRPPPPHFLVCVQLSPDVVGGVAAGCADLLRAILRTILRGATPPPAGAAAAEASLSAPLLPPRPAGGYCVRVCGLGSGIEAAVVIVAVLANFLVAVPDPPRLVRLQRQARLLVMQARPATALRHCVSGPQALVVVDTGRKWPSLLLKTLMSMPTPSSLFYCHVPAVNGFAPADVRLVPRSPP